MNMIEHARAARVIGLCIVEEAGLTEGPAAPVLFALGHAYQRAADRMEADMRREAEEHAEASRCNIPHRTGVICPACGVRSRAL